jgi:hypothetical protein
VPEKNHVELLKLLGVRLQPARPTTARASCRIRDLIGYPLLAGAKAGEEGTPPPI